ncbi:putative superoxide dismutase [Cu-Zn] [Coprinopsis sp. MPI-PUGE-AT-0042]|nr:putative superoxide dismutase [Cu-Zn] [Coprinopsis sp. MPI-PUGE-AT-0042]
MARQSLSRISALLALCALVAGYPAADNEFLQQADPASSIVVATAVLKGNSEVYGTLSFQQWNPEGPVTISGKIRNLTPNALRGLHIHDKGDISDGCANAGAHYNPFNRKHGGPSDKERHVGDLGNIKSNENGEAFFSFHDRLISLNGPLSIIGRSIVVHTGTDDLGRGDYEDSRTTGHSGGRAACGLIAQNWHETTPGSLTGNLGKFLGTWPCYLWHALKQLQGLSVYL